MKRIGRGKAGRTEVSCTVSVSFRSRRLVHTRLFMKDETRVSQFSRNARKSERVMEFQIVSLFAFSSYNCVLNFNWRNQLSIWHNVVIDDLIIWSVFTRLRHRSKYVKTWNNRGFYTLHLINFAKLCSLKCRHEFLILHTALKNVKGIFNKFFIKRKSTESLLRNPSRIKNNNKKSI